MSKLNTKQKAYKAVKSYRMQDGSKAAYLKQLPPAWQEYMLTLAETQLRNDMSICDMDISELMDDISNAKLKDVITDIFFPYIDHWLCIYEQSRASKTIQNKSIQY